MIFTFTIMYALPLLIYSLFCLNFLVNYRRKLCRFQELDLSTNAYIFSGSIREEEWYNKVVEGLLQKANYRKVRL